MKRYDCNWEFNSFLRLLALLFLLPVAVSHASSPIIWIDPDEGASSVFVGEEKAKHYLQANAEHLGLPKDLKRMSLTKTRESLFATHFHFGQTLLGLTVDDAETIVTIDRATQKISRVFSNIDVIPEESVTAANLDPEEVLDIAWAHLKVHGELTHPLSVESIIWQSKKGPKNVYKTLVSVSKPYGHWEHIIDAKTGDILSVRNTHIPRKGEHEEKSVKAWTAEFARYQGPLVTREEAELAFRPFSDGHVFIASKPVKEAATGTGLIFDPDPRTRLGSLAIEDNSDETAFDGAYEKVTLQNITKVNKHYFLMGPWVSILDFDPPAVDPSYTKDGHWTDKRGQNGFNEVMTYYHLDQSQRYLQSLGYTEEKGIQAQSIEVDANGAEGGDNSFYDPSANRLSFGHGCVDDNEDADVILHEYGHAIQRDINSNWSKGDTGAMGEGFGDYWAASYSYSMTNAKSFHPNKVFIWDGHNKCWDGRELNKTKAQYKHRKIYNAHERLDGFISDELWATPIFQSFKQLVDTGYSREEFDKVLLESHFGLGAEVKMRHVADVMVETAKRYYPNKPYFQVLRKNFKKQGILPESLEYRGMQLIDSNFNRYLDPGELAAVILPLKNVSREYLTEVKASLVTSSTDISLSRDEARYAASKPGESVSQELPFLLALSKQVACGTQIPFELHLAYAGDEAEHQVVRFATQVGKPITLEASKSASEKILDNKTLISSFTIEDTGKSVMGDLKVNLHIKHDYMGDLAVRLISPTGKKRTLFKKGPSGMKEIQGSFPDDFVAEQSLSAFIGEPFDGDWTLEVEDKFKQDEGALIEWGIEATVDYQCSPDNRTLPGV